MFTYIIGILIPEEPTQESRAHGEGETPNSFFAV